MGDASATGGGVVGDETGDSVAGGGVGAVGAVAARGAADDSGTPEPGAEVESAAPQVVQNRASPAQGAPQDVQKFAMIQLLVMSPSCAPHTVQKRCSGRTLAPHDGQ